MALNSSTIDVISTITIPSKHHVFKVLWNDTYSHYCDDVTRDNLIILFTNINTLGIKYWEELKKQPNMYELIDYNIISHIDDNIVAYYRGDKNRKNAR